MRILVIAKLFPSPSTPLAGDFFANFLVRLRGQEIVPVVVSPVPYVPMIATRLSRFSQYRSVEHHGYWEGLEVWRPCYLQAVPGGRRLWSYSRLSRLAVMPLCHALHRRHRFQLVVGYGFGPDADAAQAAAASMGLRSVSWAIGSDVHTLPQASDENARLLRHSVRHNTMVVTESDALRRTLLDYCPWARNIHPFYKGIDLDILREPPPRAALRSQLGLATDRTYMVSAGSALATKGVHEFYAAFRQLAGERPDLAALWVGGGPEEAALRDRARQDGLAERVTVTGMVSRPLALRYMYAADLMAFPTYAEGLSNAVMEALAAGLPIVTTDVGGDREVVAHEVTGLLIPAKDVAALVGGIRRILNNGDWARRMGAAGRRLILDHFDVDRNASVGAALLRHVASGGDPTAAIRACANVLPGQLPMDKAREEATSAAATPR